MDHNLLVSMSCSLLLILPLKSAANPRRSRYRSRREMYQMQSTGRHCRQDYFMVSVCSTVVC